MRVLERSFRNQVKKILKKVFLVLLIVILSLAVISVVLDLIVVGTTNGRVYSNEDITGAESFKELDSQNIECIIVLGCGVYPDGEPTPLLSDRLDIAIDLYNKGVAPKLLMSGDHGTDTYNEVAAMRRYAMERGVPSEDIFMDHAGFSTYETMYRAASIFNIKTAVVVTQHYHLYRSLYNASNLGIDACGVIATGHVFQAQSYYSFREYFARCKDFIFGIFKPNPTYMGETIDISGNGEVTLDEV